MSPLLPPLVLASASPRRVDLLGRLDGIGELVVTPSDIDEGTIAQGAPDGPSLVARVARAKAQAVWTEGHTVVAADTAVVHAGTVLGKPTDRAEAVAMLGTMRGHPVEVLTAVIVIGPRGARTDEVVRSVLHIGHPTDEAIAAYVATGAADDKAGALAVQDEARAFVDHIDGCETNVYGLPLCATTRLLHHAGRTVSGECPRCPDDPSAAG